MAIRGHKSNEIESVLGYHERDEMIHADNLVMSDS
jgi:glutamate 5-kinase